MGITAKKCVQTAYICSTPVFWECPSLTNIIIPDIVEIIGRNVLFGETILNGIKLPETIKILNNNTFIEHDVNSIIIPNNITKINDFAFKNCDLIENIIIPDSVTSIGESAFFGCSKLSNIIIPNSIIEIGEYAFGFCSSLTNVTIPNIQTSIGKDVGFCSNIRINRKNVKRLF